MSLTDGRKRAKSRGLRVIDRRSSFEGLLDEQKQGLALVAISLRRKWWHPKKTNLAGVMTLSGNFDDSR